MLRLELSWINHVDAAVIQFFDQFADKSTTFNLLVRDVGDSYLLKGGYDAGVKLVEAVNLLSHLANVGDTRSLILHPASTTHRQLSAEQQMAAGAGPDVVRLSVGIETVADIIADLDQALAVAGR